MRTSIAALASLMLLVCMPTPVQAADGPGDGGGGGFGEWLSNVISWILSGGGSSDSAGGSTEINDGQPVPVIDEGSGSFLVKRIAQDADQLHGQESTEAQQTYDTYANKLAKTLSQLNAQEQQVVFYGRS